MGSDRQDAERIFPRTTNEIDDFAFRHGLRGARLDRIANGVKGTSVETLVKICEAADINPTYLLFGKGRPRLSEGSGPLTSMRRAMSNKGDSAE